MADWISTVLRTAPLVSAAAWLLLAALQVYRDRWHTWTETFFLFACFFGGFYAIGDWLFFNSDPSSLQAQETAALISLTGLILAVNFFLLFTFVYVDRMRRAYWAIMFVTFAVLTMIWTTSIERVVPPSAGGVPIAVFAPIPFALLLAYTVVGAVLGIWNLYRLYRIVRVSSKTLARRAAGLMVTFTLVLVLGLGTNGLLGVIQNYTRTSASILRGKSLSAISHGSYTLVMERGRSAYLTVLLDGEESDQLRRQMRDLLLNFEAENRQVLSKWQGVPSDAKGTEEMLTEFFVEAPIV